MKILPEWIFIWIHENMANRLEIQVSEDKESSETVVVNLRGTKFIIETRHLKRYPSSVLCKKHIAALRTEGRCDELYFDHNPALFHHIWDAYSMSQGSRFHMPNNYCTRYVEQELEFWGLDPSTLELCCWDRLTEGQENDDTRAAVLLEWDKGDSMKLRREQLSWKQRLYYFVEEPRTSKLAAVRRAFNHFI